MRSPRRPRFSRLARILLATTLTVAAAAVVTAASAGWPRPLRQATGEFNYAEALQDSMLFYELQRSGKLPADNRVSWRGDSDLTDGADVGLDLTGGYHDAGDEVKFGLPAAYSMTTLAWGGIDNAAGYTKSGQMTYLLRNLRWGDDYIIKAHPSAARLLRAGRHRRGRPQFWGPAEVGPDGPAVVHDHRGVPGLRCGRSVGRRAGRLVHCVPGQRPDLRGHPAHPGQVAVRVRRHLPGTYDACIPDVSTFYKSWSGYWDELVWGAIWLYKATGDQTLPDQGDHVLRQPRQGQPVHHAEVQLHDDWDDNTFGAYILMAQLTGQQQYIDDAERNLDWLTVGVTAPGRRTPRAARSRSTPGARPGTRPTPPSPRWSSATGSSPGPGRHPAEDVPRLRGPADQLHPRRQPDPRELRGRLHQLGHQHQVAAAAAPPHRPRLVEPEHDRTGRAPGTSPTACSSVARPAADDTFTDDRQQYQQTEGALDYNSLLLQRAGRAGQRVRRHRRWRTSRRRRPRTDRRSTGRPRSTRPARTSSRSSRRSTTSPRWPARDLTNRPPALLLHPRRRPTPSPGQRQPASTTSAAAPRAEAVLRLDVLRRHRLHRASTSPRPGSRPGTGRTSSGSPSRPRTTTPRTGRSPVSPRPAPPR